MTFKALLTTVCFFYLPATGVALDKGILNPKDCRFADMQRFYLEELGVENVTIKIVEKRLDDPKIKGYTKHIKGHNYLVVLADHLEPSEIRVTMAHELVHVRQLENGQIKKEEFIKNYHERSFEDEAFRLSLPMAAKFYTKMDCTSKEPQKQSEDSPSEKPREP